MAGEDWAGPAVILPETFSISEMASYGLNDPQMNAINADSVAERHGGAMLSSITAVSDDVAGRVYVLDNDYKKIVVFAPNGVPQRVILGGYGSGPGEFQQPTHLVVNSGRIFVLDRGQPRVTIFDTVGTYIDSFKLTASPLPRGLAVSGDTIWILTKPGKRNRDGVVHLYSMDGELHSMVMSPTDRAIRFSRFGEPGDLSRMRNGSVIYLTGIPVIWAEFGASGGTYRGRDLLPERVPREYNDGRFIVRGTPGGTRALGQLPNGRVAVLYFEIHGGLEGPTLYGGQYIGMFADSGEPIGRYTLPDSLPFVKVFAVSKIDNAVFLAFSDPYPHVTKYG
ncbi:MAG: 6-bladed beta-propeller, partial [Candidatus Binatia bacterium]